MTHHRLDALKRIAIIGTSGSGKTTLANDLSCLLELPHTQLDTLHWGPDWTTREDFLTRVEAAVSQDAWVIDGNYSQARALVWGRAQAIIWLKYPFTTTTSRVIRRSLKRLITQEVLFGGNTESWRKTFCTKDSIIYWSVKTWAKHRREYPARLSRVDEHVRVITLSSPQQAQGFKKTLAMLSPATKAAGVDGTP